MRPGRLLTETEAARVAGLRFYTMMRALRAKDFPLPSIEHGEAGFYRDEVEAWRQENASRPEEIAA